MTNKERVIEYLRSIAAGPSGSGCKPACRQHVCLLEKTKAEVRFLVFGNDRRVPEKWLATYGDLASDCDFYFLTRDGQLQRMRAPGVERG